MSITGLLFTLVPSVLYFYDHITFDIHKTLMLLGTALWFLSAPFWMNKPKETT
jgi:hypothetical protein